MTAAGGVTRGARRGPTRIAKLPRFVGNRIAPLVLVAALWELLAHTPVRAGGLLPPFTSVLTTIGDLIAHSDLLFQLGVSLYRALVGLAIAVVAGIAIGLGIAFVPPIRRAISPIVTMTYSLPKSALIPIAFLWLGVGDTADILVAVLGSIVPIIVSTFQGARAVPAPLVQSARSLGATRMRLFRTVTLPGMLPYIVPAFRIALAFSIVVVISAEMVGSFTGVGQYIYNFSQNGSYPQMWAGIVVTVTAVFILDSLAAAASRYFLRWR